MGTRRIAVVLILAALAGLAGSGESRSFTFLGEALKADNISAVLLVGNRVLLADDELRAILVGTESGKGHEFAAAPLTPPPAMTPGDEFDLEGLALSGSHVFAVGSHAAVRTGADDVDRSQEENRKRQLRTGPRPDRDWVFRFTLGPDNKPADQVAVSLRPLIEKDPLLGPFLSVPSKENGVDIEGLAVDGDRLFVGFRGPVLRHGFAPVLEVSGFPKLVAGPVRFLSLGGRGIRDLVKVQDGFLVLGGPAGDSDQDHRIYFWNGLDCVPGKGAAPCVIRDLTLVPPSGGARSEGIAVLGEDGTGYDVLVVFDGVGGGAPQVMRVRK
jgi:hypothetical protein